MLASTGDDHGSVGSAICGVLQKEDKRRPGVRVLRQSRRHGEAWRVSLQRRRTCVSEASASIAPFGGVFGAIIVLRWSPAAGGACNGVGVGR